MLKTILASSLLLTSLSATSSFNESINGNLLFQSQSISVFDTWGDTSGLSLDSLDTFEYGDLTLISLESYMTYIDFYIDLPPGSYTLYTYRLDQDLQNKDVYGELIFDDNSTYGFTNYDGSVTKNQFEVYQFNTLKTLKSFRFGDDIYKFNLGYYYIGLYSSAYANIYSQAYSSGFDVGYAIGVSDAFAIGGNQANLINLFGSIASTPATVLGSLMNVPIFGTNLFTLFTSLLTLLIVVWVVKKILT